MQLCNNRSYQMRTRKFSAISPYLRIGREADPRFGTEVVKIMLVNLHSRMYAAKRQGPLAVDTLAGYLRVKTNSLVARIDMQKLFDARPGDESLDQKYDLIIRNVIDEVIQRRPKMVGLSLKWGTTEMAKKIVSAVREKLQKDAPLFIFGGSMPTFAGNEIIKLDEFRNVIMVRGEGEGSMRQIVERAATDPHAILDPQLYRGIHNVQVMPDEKIAWQLLDLENYPVITEADLPEYYFRPTATPIESSRGCSWGHCTFCSLSELYSQNKSSHLPRQYKVDYIIDRIRRIISSKLYLGNHPNVHFIDSEWISGLGQRENFSLVLERAEAIARGIIAINQEFDLAGKMRIHVWNFSARVDSVTMPDDPQKDRQLKDLYRFLKEAGFEGVYLGVESGSPTQLRRYGKGVSVEHNARAIARLRELNFPFEPGFIFFDPLATMEELKANIKFIERTKLFENISRIFGEMRPQMGSPYVKLLRKEGFLGKIDLDALSYEADYVDPEVEALKQSYLSWEKQNRPLFSHISGLWTEENKNIEDVLRRICRSNFEFLKGYLFAHADDRDNIYKKNLMKQKGMIKWVQKQVRKGKIPDQKGRIVNEFIPQALASNEELMRQIPNKL